MKAPSHLFGMFAKFWEPGRAKTRLAHTIGAERAAQVYKAFLDAQTRRYADQDNPLLVYAEEKHESAFQQLIASSQGWRLQPQGSGDLGDRMQLFFQRAFTNGYESAALVGSDTPTLPTNYLLQAKSLLRLFDVVLGPTEDGGYYLVGARKEAPPIFDEIAWSTPQVWQQTIARLQQHQIRFAVLPTWYDVDDLADLERLRSEIAGESQDKAIMALRERLQEVLAK